MGLTLPATAAVPSDAGGVIEMTKPKYAGQNRRLARYCQPCPAPNRTQIGRVGAEAGL